MGNFKQSEYRTTQWKNVREKILKRDGYKCKECGKSEPEVRLSVHHHVYYPEREIWNYPDEYLITLCRDCHAKIHGRAMPSKGWIWVGSDDLGDLIGTCDICPSSIRYEHYLFHENWGYITVGSVCAERLTEIDPILNKEKELRKIANSIKKYMKGEHWRTNKNGHFLDLKGYSISIWDNLYNAKVIIHYYRKIINEETGNIQKICIEIKGKNIYKNVDEAKFAILHSIFTGALSEYIKKHEKIDNIIE